jgi:hypothetical protein
MSQERILAILSSDAPDGAKVAAIASLITGKTTARELAEVCNVKVRTMERHNTDAKSLVRKSAEVSKEPLRNIAEGVRKSAGEDTQICVEIPRADSCAGATKELPTEVVILNNIPPNPLPIEKPKRAKSEGPTPLEALRAFEAYNEVALRCGLPQAAKLTPKRAKSICARLRTYGTDGWAVALENLEKSAFCRGMTSHNFRADLTFVCQEKSFDRLYEGGYGNGAHTAPKAGLAAIRIEKTDRQTDAELQEWARSLQ